MAVPTVVAGAANRHATAREKLYSFLQSRPAGADSRELIGLLFSGTGSDPELGQRLVGGLIGRDPNFLFDPHTNLWSLRECGMLRVPLSEVSFCVVDLETTGGRPGPDRIIEIGAYRMEGQRMVDSFDTLVRPRGPIPRFISRLTSITDQMVSNAPTIERVIPAFRDFLGDSVLVAHNARFDHSFLDFEFRRIFGIGLRNPVLCTLRMARRFMPSLKRRRLDLLAEHFGLSTAGRHRGLGDARMAAEILSIFLEIAARMGLGRLDRLLDDHGRGHSGIRYERHVSADEIAALPTAPGVYLMRNQRGDLLYVGMARRLRDRVSSYFNASVNARTAELIGHVYKIETRVTPSSLDAALMEAQLIRELKPPYNRMLKSVAPAYFLKLDLMDEFPRLQVAGKMNRRRGVLHLGPFIGRRNLDNAVRALSKILGLRTCTGRLEPTSDFSPCIYGQMGHCTAPCNGAIDGLRYGARVSRALAFIRGRSGPLLGDLARARDQAARSFRYEEAGRLKRDLEALTTLAHRASRLSQVVTENNLVIILGEKHNLCAHVILSGRLALTRRLDSCEATDEIQTYIKNNYELFRMLPIERHELEPMTIVARWLRERQPDEGRLVYLRGPEFDSSNLGLGETAGDSHNQ